MKEELEKIKADHEVQREELAVVKLELDEQGRLMSEKSLQIGAVV